MINIPPKIKEQLALLYDYPEFKALEKWSELHRQACADQMIGVPMGEQGSSERIAMLQGQAEAHKIMLLELCKIHKDITKD
jgi:hypothetical protein